MAMDRLLECIRANDTDGVEAALDQGASVDTQDEHGWTPLCWAAGVGNADILRALLARGADPGHCGADRRTPYLIALAAGHREAARLLGEEERRRAADETVCSSLSGRDRPYCRAYPLDALARFPGWSRRDETLRDASASDDAEDDDGIVFLHRDFTVSRSIWAGESVVFDAVNDAWRAFCTQELGFSPPGDLDLLEPPHAG
ncbi:MAG: ankyrin repeat domain-containing protein [Pseudomonadota bacterium]